MESLLGHWSGTSTELPFDRFIHIEILQENEKWLLRYMNRRYPSTLVVPLNLESEETFQAILPHWIIRKDFRIHGKLDSFNKHSLELRIHGEGMTGLENYTVELHKDGTGYESYMRPLAISKDLSSASSFTASCDHDQATLQSKLTSRILKDFSGPDDQPLQPRIESLTIIKDNRILIEQGFWGMDINTLHQISSCTKSITSILAGVAIDQGLFSLDDKVVDYFPSITTTTWGQEPPILVHHALSMTSGTVHSISDAQDLLEGTDIEALVLSSKRITDPGTKYHYDNGLPALVGRLIEVKSNMSFENFAQKHLFGPLGIIDYSWTRMRAYEEDTPLPVLTAGGLRLSVQSLTTIANMLLNNGVSNGTRIVSASYLKAATSRQTPDEDYPYGFYFHLNSQAAEDGIKPHVRGLDGYFALGQGQQVVFVCPRERILMIGLSSSWFQRQLPEKNPSIQSENAEAGRMENAQEKNNQNDISEHYPRWAIFDLLEQAIRKDLNTQL